MGEGQEVDVELEFSLTYSPRDAVGYVNGYMVIVEGGRPSLGERRKVRITSATRTGGDGGPGVGARAARRRRRSSIRPGLSLIRPERFATISCRCLEGS